MGFLTPSRMAEIRAMLADDVSPSAVHDGYKWRSIAGELVDHFRTESVWNPINSPTEPGYYWLQLGEHVSIHKVYQFEIDDQILMFECDEAKFSEVKAWWKAQEPSPMSFMEEKIIER